MFVHLERNMTHRHINSGKELSSAAIDDIIGRGSLAAPPPPPIIC